MSISTIWLFSKKIGVLEKEIRAPLKGLGGGYKAALEMM